MKYQDVLIKDIKKSFPNILYNRLVALKIVKLQEVLELDIQKFSLEKGIGEKVVSQLIDYQKEIEADGIELFFKKDIQSQKIINIDEKYLPIEFEFIKNLIENTEIEEGTLVLEINNSQGRKLDSIFNSMIDSFYDEYVSGMNTITVSRKFKREKIINDPLQISRELIGDIFTEFNWVNYSEAMIQTHQENLVNRKI